MSIFKTKKAATFYSVVKKDNPQIFLTITATEKEAVEYGELLLKQNHKSHFEAWCKLRELDSEFEDSWIAYCSQCISKEEIDEYLVIKLEYNLPELAIILRIFGGCVPLGCSFDSELEHVYYQGRKSEENLADKVSESSNIDTELPEGCYNGNE